MFEQLKIGIQVHYVHPNGTHSQANVLKVYKLGVVDLSVRPDDDNSERYTRQVVVYSETPKASTWHFVEKD